MMLSELVERLTEIYDTHGDREVRLAYQPSYPLAAEVLNIWDPVEEPDVDDWLDEGDEEPEPQPEPDSVPPLWIASSEGLEDRDESPYAPRRAFGEDYL